MDTGERKFSTILQQIRDESTADGLTLRRLLVIVGPRGHLALTLILVLPFLQPIPLPGLSTPLGLSIAALGFFLAIHQPPWLPERFAARTIDAKSIARILKLLDAIVGRLEKFVRPRGRRFFSAPLQESLTGWLIFIHAVVLALPLPIPLTNIIPGYVLFLLALACLEEDLYLYLAGCVVMVVNAAYFTALVFFPYVLGEHWIKH